MSTTLSRSLVGAACLFGVTIGPALAQAPPAPPPPPESAAPAQTPPEPQPGPAPATAAEPAPGSEPARRMMGRVRGAITDSAHKPIVGILVKLASVSEAGLLRITGTNERGQYLFQDLPPGVYDVQIEAEGFRPASKGKVDVRPPFQNIVDFTLLRLDEAAPTVVMRLIPGVGAPRDTPPPAPAAVDVGAGTQAPVTVRGRFVDSAKHPLAEVSVLLAAIGGPRIHQAYSGEDGGFELPDVVPGRYRVVVRSPGHVPLDLRLVEVLPERGLNLSLMLVDYPLNFKAGDTTGLPQERPRPLKTAPQAPADTTPADTTPADALPPGY